MGLLCTAQGAWAQYEVDKNTVNTYGVPLGSEPFKWNWQENGDVQIDWNATAEEPSGFDTLLYFYYHWSGNENQLPNSSFNSTINDGVSDASTNPYMPSTTNSTLFQERGFNNENSLAYLHVKTYFYNASSGLPELSDDVVIGPINMDNVAPSGTVQLVDAEGNPVESTSKVTVDFRLNASVNPQYYYIQEDSTSSPNPGIDRYPYNSTIEYTLLDSNPGSKKVFVWFEDSVGNISYGNFASDSFELLGDVYISPNEATIDLSQAATKVFYVEGTTEGYDWSVINESTSNVAQISTTATNATSITLEGLNPGTCQVQAVPSDVSGDTLTSGTITVEEIKENLDIDDNGQATALGDGVLIVRYLYGFTGDTLINGVVDLANGNRTTAPEIIDYLDALVP